ncbi:MAG: class I SAM-dependent methyltransferase [Pseudomonadota bacterium]
MNFWDKIADKYSRRPIADEEAYNKKLEITRGYFRPDMDIFEFGCGTGGTALLHAPYVKSVKAIDVSSNMISIAKRKQKEMNINNIEFSVSGIDEYKFVDKSYDAIFGMSILHLLEDKEAIIRKVHSSLTTGGFFITSTPCLHGIMKLFKVILPIGRTFSFLPPIVKFFNTKELEQSITNNGFEIDHHWVVNDGRVVFIVAKKK